MPSRFRFDLLAKAGYTARGVVFLLVAGLALFSGVTGGQPEMKSALLTLLGQPLGRPARVRRLEIGPIPCR